MVQVAKNLPANARDTDLLSGLGKSPGKGNGNSLQYSCLGNPMDRGAWWAIAHGVAESKLTQQLSMHICIQGVAGYRCFNFDGSVSAEFCSRNLESIQKTDV